MNLHFSHSRNLLSAVVGSIVSLGSAFALPVPPPQSGEIYVGFRSSNSSESYIVKLGQDTTFRQATSSISLTNLGNIGADLTATFGEDWSSNKDVHWGVFGVITGPASVLYTSRERNPVTQNTLAWPGLDTTSRNTTASQITSVLESLGGYKSLQATANSPVGAIQPNSANASSYNFQVASAGNNDFGSLSQWSSIEGDFGGGVAGTALDLYRIGSAVVRVGYFTISAAGDIQFNLPTTTTPPVNVDTDGDGFLDSQEAIAGTSPTDASDFFRVQSVQHTSGGAGISFKTVPTSTYKIYYSQDLSANSWTLIHTEPGGAAPAVFQYTDTDLDRKARGKGFYKVSVSR